MRKVLRIISSIFIANRLGWILAILNFIALYLFFWVFGNGLHNLGAYGCVDGKITLVSPYYNPHFGHWGQLGKTLEMFLLFIVPLNIPGFLLGAVLSGFFFQSSPECIVIPGFEWKYSWAYIIQICLIIACIITQWLIIGAILKKMGKLVKES